MSQFNFTYNFKTLTLASGKYASFLAEFDETEQANIASYFEEVKDGDKLIGYKRKPQVESLTMPDWAASLPSSLATDLVQAAIADFCKSQYIDNFLPVGQHDWAFIEQTLAEVRKRGGSISLQVSDEAWQAAANSMATFLNASGTLPKVVEAISKVLTGKVRAAGIRRAIGNDKPETLEKLKLRITDWATWAAEHDAEQAETFATVYQAAISNLDKMLKVEAQVDIASLL